MSSRTIPGSDAPFTAMEHAMARARVFTRAVLASEFPEAGEAVAKQTIERWQRRGWIDFTRKGRVVTWAITDFGREQIARLLELPINK